MYIGYRTLPFSDKITLSRITNLSTIKSKIIIGWFWYYGTSRHILNYNSSFKRDKFYTSDHAKNV